MMSRDKRLASWQKGENVRDWRWQVGWCGWGCDIRRDWSDGKAKKGKKEPEQGKKEPD